MPGGRQKGVCMIAHLVLTKDELDLSYYSHFTDEEIEMRGSDIVCSRSKLQNSKGRVLIQVV